MNEDELSSSSSEDDDDEETKILKRGGVSYKAEGSARQQATLENISKQIKKSTNESNDDQNLELKPEIDDGIYRGNLNLRHQLPKGSAKYGPIKGGPDNIKTITLVDYQPDVCKDYKDTGFCGFGDTCKFLHDRSDYMHGWQLDDAFNSTKNKMKEEEEEEEIPFACLICRKPFEDPIVTKCQHYFCSNCAIKRFNKNPKCFACGSSTNGIFNK
ncbi:hypothetical protein CROQUDRAFT_38360 [Cronartium quercuum f. sp. fusiforme G11]|uniref:Pre-mRNA-splicing factor CWC24 n=1 Tax=Cronartium quercuum f. sp. fusiforme G11 TaxID=708437 RepID=A0A9P6NRQ2_9BASI|nr:hypothetical protein CROQUDRAFT_38360 [Cronartium quercuum f. sp. fusiforme G11]